MASRGETRCVDVRRTERPARPNPLATSRTSSDNHSTGFRIVWGIAAPPNCQFERPSAHRGRIFDGSPARATAHGAPKSDTGHGTAATSHAKSILRSPAGASPQNSTPFARLRLERAERYADLKLALT